MTNQITNLITKELLSPEFEMTKDYLKVMQVKYEDDIPKIARIDIDEASNRAKAYLEVVKEDFYLEFTFDTFDEIELYSVDTAPFININFILSSEDFTLDELLALTSLKPNEMYSKGETFSNGTFEHSINGLVFESYSGPGNLPDKLDFLLDFLESDVEGIREISRQTGCNDLFVTIVYHLGVGMFTGLFLDKQTINRLSNLGLALTFDLYVAGKKLEYA